MKKEIDFDKFITEALKEESIYNLPSDFAERMTQKVERKHTWKTSLLEYSWYAALVVGLAFVAFTTFYFINKESFTQLLSFINKNLISILALAFIANFVLFADKVLLRMLFSMKK